MIAVSLKLSLLSAQAKWRRSLFGAARIASQNWVQLCFGAIHSILLLSSPSPQSGDVEKVGH